MFAAAYAEQHGANGPHVVAGAADDLMREYDDRWSPGHERKVFS
jgi:hypothetical protein